MLSTAWEFGSVVGFQSIQMALSPAMIFPPLISTWGKIQSHENIRVRIDIHHSAGDVRT